MAKVTTKTGDKGTTQMGKARVSKTSPDIKLVGGLDSLQAHISIYDDSDYLETMIYELMSSLHTGSDVSLYVAELEDMISEYDMSKISNEFIIPADPRHLVRTKAREVEILAWEAGRETIAVVLNRLSDLYFLKAVLDV